MSTRSAKKLLLNKETLRNLQDAELRQVVGGRQQGPLAGEKSPFQLTAAPCGPITSTQPGCSDIGRGG